MEGRNSFTESWALLSSWFASGFRLVPKESKDLLSSPLSPCTAQRGLRKSTNPKGMNDLDSPDRGSRSATFAVMYAFNGHYYVSILPSSFTSSGWWGKSHMTVWSRAQKGPFVDFLELDGLGMRRSSDDEEKA